MQLGLGLSLQSRQNLYDYVPAQDAPQKQSGQSPNGARSQQAIAGFTLIQGLMVMGIVGILGAISVPTWLNFQARQNLNAAQTEAYQVIRTTQSTATQHRDTRQASFRQAVDTVQWAIHPADLIPTEAHWQDMEATVQIDSEETTLRLAGGVYRVQFSHRGTVNGQLGRLTFSSPHGGQVRRCVFVSTLLGAARRGENHSQPDRGGRHCR